MNAIAVKMSAFIDKYGAAADAAAAGSPIFPETILSAAALESGYGKSQLSSVYNNFFGIKKQNGDGWTGKTVTFSTKEQKADGTVYTVNAQFRHYDTAEDAFKNYVKFIQGPRYVKAGVTKASNPVEQFNSLKAAGYATDVKYADKLTNIFKNVGSWVVKHPVAAASGGLASVALLLLGLFFLTKK